MKFVPVSVTFAPALALAGANLAIVGTGAVSGRKPFLTKIAWPAGLSTLSIHACAAAWFGLFVTIAIA